MNEIVTATLVAMMLAAGSPAGLDNADNDEEYISWGAGSVTNLSCTVDVNIGGVCIDVTDLETVGFDVVDDLAPEVGGKYRFNVDGGVGDDTSFCVGEEDLSVPEGDEVFLQIFIGGANPVDQLGCDLPTTATTGKVIIS